jgi:hypothetical protein
LDIKCSKDWRCAIQAKYRLYALALGGVPQKAAPEGCAWRAVRKNENLRLVISTIQPERADGPIRYANAAPHKHRQEVRHTPVVLNRQDTLPPPLEAARLRVASER